MTRAAQILIRAYAYIVSPFLGQNCRFYPSCSCYAHQALEQHGFLKGMFLTLARIFKCHPWSRANMIDPVPKRFAWQDILRYKRLSNTDDEESRIGSNKQYLEIKGKTHDER